MKKQYTILIMLIAFLSLSAQALFEVKDSNDNTVLEVSQDGLRIFNMGDTLMVISSTEIKAFIDESAKDRALSRSFSITTATAGKGGNEVVNIAADGLRVYNENDKLMDITGSNITAYIDSSEGKALSRSFSITTATAGKAEVDVLEVTTGATKMREGDAGARYTDFSPENIFLGLGTGESTEEENNVFIGNRSGFSNTLGGNNVYIGTESGYFSTNTYQNTYVGYRSGYSMAGASNTVIGSTAGENAGGGNCTFIGTSAGKNFDGGNNTFVGISAGYGGDTIYAENRGERNTYVGQRCGYSTTSGYRNVFMGFDAGWGNRTGSSNTIIGYEAGKGSYDVSYDGNVFLGAYAGTNETASDRLYIANTTVPLIYGEFDNKKVGINTTTPAADLHLVGGTTLGSLMIAPSETSSDDDAEIVLAEDNDGTYNMSMKYDGGSNRLEWWAEQSGTDYGPLMYLGYNTLGGGIGYLYTGPLRPMADNIFDLGYSTLRWRNVYAANGVIQTSDKRQKSNIKDMNYGLNTILKMRPVTYFWKDKPERGRKVGLIAQELLDIVPEIVDIGEDENHTLGLNYAELTPILVKALQEQEERIKKLEELIEKLLK